MHNKFKHMTAVALVVTGLGCGLAAAQGLPEPLVNAARKAVTTNPEVQARWHNFTAADNERNVARGGYFPRADLTAQTGRNSLRRTDIGSQDYGRNGVGLTLNQMLFDGFFTKNEVQRLSYAKLTRYYELAEISETTALEALRAYADVTRQTELVEQAKLNYMEHKATSQLIEERADAGVSRRVDLEQATGRLALAESNLLTEISNLHDVTARYLRIMGERPAAGLPALPEKLMLNGLPASALESMNQGLAASPTINAAYENVRAAKMQIESNKAAYYPRFDARAGQSFDLNGNQVIYGDSRNAFIELLMTYNLFRGGSDKAREKQAIELQYQARDLQEKACRDVRQTLAIAYNDVQRLTEQLNYLGQHRLSTEKARQAYRQQFEIGQRTLLDMLNTQNEYFEASRAHINARYNHIIAQARTLSSMGRLNAALDVSRPDQPTASDAGQDRGELPPEELCPFEAPAMLMVDKTMPPRAPRAMPVPVAPKAVVPTKVTLSADALFDFDKSVLKPEGKKQLDDLVEKMKGFKLEAAIAVGHTDGIGSVEYNQRLSLARAQSVKTYMVSQGIAADLIKVDGKGKSQPVADNATAEGRAKNRRVEIHITEVADMK